MVGPWKLYIDLPQERALKACRGSLTEGDGYGCGWGYGYSDYPRGGGWGIGAIFGYGLADGGGWGDAFFYGSGLNVDGGSSTKW